MSAGHAYRTPGQVESEAEVTIGSVMDEVGGVVESDYREKGTVKATLLLTKAVLVVGRDIVLELKRLADSRG